jgi:hypothetical protein|tara:strand:+ start:324 stop:1064 length:741 start_codon:yes stop_codon:yes gene_type:complete
MLNLKDLKVLILEDNNLTNLTVNSLKENTPEISYKVISKEEQTESKIGTALLNSKHITLVVSSGIVLELKDTDIPDLDVLEEYDICVSRYAVYMDHDRLKAHYYYVNKKLTDGVIDLSLFIINPKRWRSIPDSDIGILEDVKKLFIPRYMHHKNDILFEEEATSAVDAFNYGVLGEQASVFNYIDCINKDTINILETYGYCFDKLLPYIKGVPRKEQNRIKLLANNTITKIKNTRNKMHLLNTGTI